MLNHIFPKILFRKNKWNEEEFNIASKYFDCITSRCQLDFPKLNIAITTTRYQGVLGRYSVLPYYQEVNYDLGFFRHELINSPKQHKYIADFLWYNDVIEHTPQTWFHDLSQCDHDGPFVVKGKTNSKKNQWATKMFARDRKEALLIASELMSDDNIAQQGVIFREFVPLKTLEVGVGGMRFSNEWRFFFYKNKIIDYGYYWEIAEEDTINRAQMTAAGLDFVNKIANIISEHVPFFVLDIAQKEDSDDWILVEVNDGQMSGLQCIDPEQFYCNLVNVFL
jgi:hypothetical protein